MYLRDFGPFRDASIDVRPLTILVGRNSVGKSMLLQLIWSLTTVMPDLEKLVEQASRRGADEIAEKILEAVKEGSNVEDYFRKLVKLYIEALPDSLASGFGEALRRVFGTRLVEVVREGSENAVVGIKTPRAQIEFVVSGEEVRVSRHEPYSEFLSRIKVLVPQSGRLRVMLGERIEYDNILASLGNLVEALVSTLVTYIFDAYGLFLAESVSTLLPDSRAGVSRILLKPYTTTRLLRDISYADEHYRDTYFMLIESLDKGDVDARLLEPLLNELGCRMHVAWESGVYTMYIDTWSGKRLTVARAPSGIRETLIVALALSSRSSPRFVFVEEPEAHLHPRAQRVLVRLIAKAVNTLGKTVVLSTHSDYILYTVSNLIMLSSTQEAHKLGFEEDEILNPKNVAVYLVRADPKSRSAVVEKLDVTSEGVSEEEFAKVAEELAEERAKILG